MSVPDSSSTGFRKALYRIQYAMANDRGAFAAKHADLHAASFDMSVPDSSSTGLRKALYRIRYTMANDRAAFAATHAHLHAASFGQQAPAPTTKTPSAPSVERPRRPLTDNAVVPPPPRVRPRQGLAIASLVLGIVSIYPLFLVGFIPGVLALAFGLNHRTEARRLRQEPSAMGTAGWICGLIGIILSVVIWIFMIIAMTASSH
jgi:hypothetical protein